MHHVADGGRPAQRVLLVAPPSQAGAPEVLYPFFPAPDVALENARLVCSDDDPYCPEGAANLYTGLPTDLLPGAGHINPDAGFGPWPAAEAWGRPRAPPPRPAPGRRPHHPGRRLGPGPGRRGVGAHRRHAAHSAVTSSRIAPG